jgi:riboflavin biosynthesis pyrimidine reductase
MIQPQAVDLRAALPSKTHPRGTEAIERLFEAEPDLAARPVAPSQAARVETRGGLSGELAGRYDGPLEFRLPLSRPTLIANFVETIDGVVAMDAGKSGGGEVSGFSPADRFVMGLLRTFADVVLVGAGTLRASDGGGWTGSRIYPSLSAEFAELRRGLGLTPTPLTLVATSSGDIDPKLPGLADPSIPVVIAGPAAAIDNLETMHLPAHVRLEPLPQARQVGDELFAVAGRLGGRLVLSEAGPHLTGKLVSAGMVDELFLTVAPQLAGRAAGVSRLSLLEGHALWPQSPRWLRLMSLRKAGDHLFMRYGFEESGDGR